MQELLKNYLIGYIVHIKIKRLENYVKTYLYVCYV